jgi:type VI secretion system protein ImpK
MFLIDTFIDLFYFTTVNKNYSFEQFSCPVLRKKYDEMIAESEKTAQKNGFSSSMWRTALFAVTVWIDECILLSDWAEKSGWHRETLQRIYFQTSNGGVEFFSNLEKLAPEDNEIRETYDLCLSLGFRGTYYRDSDKSMLHSIITGTIELLKSNRAAVLPKTLFPCAYKENDLFRMVHHNFMYLYLIIIVSVPALLFFLLYFVLNSALTSAMIKWFQPF